MNDGGQLDKVDVAVIGAGVSGLLCGALLAKAGLSVCVFEKATRPGGYLMGFERGEFTFDTSTHWLNECGPGGLVRIALDMVGDDAPVMPPLGRIKRYKSATMDYTLTNHPDELRDQLAADYPAEKDGIHRFFADSRYLNAHIFGPYRRERRDPVTRSRWAHLNTMMRLASPGLKMRKLSIDSVEERLASYFSKELAGTIYRTDQNILSCMFPVGWAYDGDYQRPPDGGGKQIPLFLARKLEAFGSQLSLGTPVVKVETAGKSVTGVTVAQPDGTRRTVRCDHLVAACDMLTVLKTLLPVGVAPAKRISHFEHADIYGSIFAMSLGLNTDAEKLGLDEAVCYLTNDNQKRHEHGCPDPNKAAISVVAPSVRDHSLAPPGKSTLSIQTSVPITYENNWHTGPDYERTGDYKAFKKAYGETLIDRVERDLVPGLRAHIEVMDVATPVTHLRYTGNYQGSIMGTKPTGFNFRHRLGGHKSALKNMWMAGHWAQCGGGVPLAVKAATTATLMLLKQVKPAAFLDYCRQIDQS